MHSIAEIGTNVPAFLGKLWKMVEDPVTNDLIAWSSSGTSFVIKDEIRFARELLPMYYKHNNMASFVRQLNMYGFHKIVSPDAGSMKLETPDEIKFTHPFFMRGHPYLLDSIKRKIGVSKVVTNQLGEKSPQVLNKVLSDVRQMKGRQENIDSRLSAMKLENGALWRELSVLRQKHLKQQQIVNKLIQFLVTIVQQNHNSFSVKRKYPRMLQHHDKTAKHEDDLHENTSNKSNSPTGPVIHELDPAEALLETVVEEANADTPTEVNEYFLTQPNKDIDDMIVDIEMPQSVEMQNDDGSAETIIGLTEDNLVPSMKNKPQNTHNSNNNNIQSGDSVFLQKIIKKENKFQRPKYLITKKPKKNIENQQKVLQRQLVAKNTRQQEEKTLLQMPNKNTDDMTVDIEMPQSVEMYRDDDDAETIIGMSEDNLVPSLKNKPQNTRNNNNNIQSDSVFIPKIMKRENELQRPKYLLITKKPKNNIENQQKVLQRQLLVQNTQQQMEKTLQQQLQINQQQLDINQQQLVKSKQQQIQHKQSQKSQQKQRNVQVLLRNKPQQLQKSQQLLQQSQQQQLQSNQHYQLQKNQRQQILKNQQQQIQRNQQQQLLKNQQQEILLQNLQQQQLPNTEEVITIPFDTGTSEDIVIPVDEADLEPLYVQGAGEDFSLPVVVEVPPSTGSPAQVSPASVSPQDLLVSSTPMVLNDPVMTPQCEPVVTPVVTPVTPVVTSPEPNSDMQVACVDESQVTSPQHVTRNEMDCHLDTVQSDLDNLKELLRSEGISLDANALLGYFNDDPLSYNISDPISGDDPKENMGNELMTCNPPLFDFSDLMGNDWNLLSPGEQIPLEDSLAEVNTPQFTPHSPSFAAPAKKRKK